MKYFPNKFMNSIFIDAQRSNDSFSIEYIANIFFRKNHSDSIIFFYSKINYLSIVIIRLFKR